LRVFYSFICFLGRFGIILIPLLLSANFSVAQESSSLNSSDWATSPGVIGTFVLLLIVVLIAILILSYRLSGFFQSMKNKRDTARKLEFSEELYEMEDTEIDSILEKRKAALRYKLSGEELGGRGRALDEKGVLTQVTHDPDN